MAMWLFKEEPDHYSFADLKRDGKARWDGVKNHLARKHLRSVRKGDRILYYHTGKEKAVVGLMRAVSDATADPEADDPAAVAVEVAAEQELHQRVTLSQIKEDALLADWELVRLSRLSVMPVTEVQWRRVMELSRSKD